MRELWQGLLGQLIALATFFAFPALQNIWLKRASSREGAANLSFSPRYGFRLAVANQFGRRVLSQLRWRALIRRVRPTADGRRPGLIDDTHFLAREDFFLFPGADQILVAFKLRRTGTEIQFVPTSVVGEDREPLSLAGEPLLICDFTATIEMRFNFDYHIAKRLTIDIAALIAACTDKTLGHLEPRDWRLLNDPAILQITSVD